MNKIIKRIAQLRDQYGWTNNRLSVEAGIGSATVINWYKRNALPKIEAIQAVCDAFGITLAEFFNEEPQPISLSEIQKDFLTEFDQLGNDEKRDLLQLIQTMNKTRKRFQ